MIYPDTPQYPGDQYLTTSWYDANGFPMFNETLAYGKEHNNTVSGMRRTWTDWFNHWSRDAGGNRIYAAATPPESLALQVVPNVLNLRTISGLVTSVITAPAGIDLREWGLSAIAAAGAPAVSAAYTSDGRSLVVTFSKAQLSSLPAGDNVRFVVTGQFNRSGVQWPMTMAAAVKVIR